MGEMAERCYKVYRSEEKGKIPDIRGQRSDIRSELEIVMIRDRDASYVKG